MYCHQRCVLLLNINAHPHPFSEYADASSCKHLHLRMPENPQRHLSNGHSTDPERVRETPVCPRSLRQSVSVSGRMIYVQFPWTRNGARLASQVQVGAREFLSVVPIYYLYAYACAMKPGHQSCGLSLQLFTQTRKCAPHA